jgi:hypothetical protein
MTVPSEQLAHHIEPMGAWHRLVRHKGRQQVGNQRDLRKGLAAVSHLTCCCQSRSTGFGVARTRGSGIG